MHAKSVRSSTLAGAGHPRRDRLDGDGHGRHDHGRPARPGRDRGAGHGHRCLHGDRDLRHGPDAGARHVRVPGLRRGDASTNACGGCITASGSPLSSAPLLMALDLAGVRTLDPWGLHPAIARSSALTSAPSRSGRYRCCSTRASGATCRASTRAAGDVRTDHRQPRERRRQLGADLRSPRNAGARCQGSAWATDLARVYMAAFLYVAIRLVHRRRGHATRSSPCVSIMARMRRLIATGPSRRVADRARSRRIRGRDGDGGKARSGCRPARIRSR